jgi:hypothetical protein
LDPDRNQCLSGILGAAGTMINGLLHVTTIEADAVRVEYTEINLYKLLEELRANYDLRGVTVYVRHVPEADMFELKVRIPE